MSPKASWPLQQSNGRHQSGRCAEWEHPPVCLALGPLIAWFTSQASCKGCLPGLGRVCTWKLPPLPRTGPNERKPSNAVCLQSQLVRLISPPAPSKTRCSVALHRGCLETPHCTFKPSGRRIRFPLPAGIVLLVCDEDCEWRDVAALFTRWLNTICRGSCCCRMSVAALRLVGWALCSILVTVPFKSISRTSERM